MMVGLLRAIAFLNGFIFLRCRSFEVQQSRYCYYVSTKHCQELEIVKLEDLADHHPLQRKGTTTNFNIALHHFVSVGHDDVSDDVSDILDEDVVQDEFHPDHENFLFKENTEEEEDYESNEEATESEPKECSENEKHEDDGINEEATITTDSEKKQSSEKGEEVVKGNIDIDAFLINLTRNQGKNQKI